MEKEDEVPSLFRCPISMELMENPVTLSSGVSYEKKYIERWLFTYKKNTCPATMQLLESFDLIPNHNLSRLISSWLNASTSAPPQSSADVSSLLAAVESGPFLVTSLKKLQPAISSEEAKIELVKLGGIQVLGTVVLQILSNDSGDFAVFRASEEALALINLLPLSEKLSISFVSKPEFIQSMIFMLQRGSSDARLHAITILQKISEGSGHQNLLLNDGEFLGSLLELVSDNITAKASAVAMDVMIKLIGTSKKSRLKAVELGAVHILLELLPDSNRNRCEKLLLLLKLLLECPEGRTAFVEHDMGIPVVTKKILRVSDLASKLGVKILWLVCTFHSTEKMMEGIMQFGSASKLIVMLQFNGNEKIRAKILNIVKLLSVKRRHHPCLPPEFKGIL